VDRILMADRRFRGKAEVHDVWPARLGRGWRQRDI